AEQPLARVAVPAASFDVAARLALCVAGTASVGLWMGCRRSALGSETAALWADGSWLRAVLARVLGSLGEIVEPDAAVDAVLFETLVRQAGTGRMLSLWPCRLAEAGS
nr:hypothetical protein [Micromonospora sp. DSM 115978]